MADAMVMLPTDPTASLHHLQGPSFAGFVVEPAVPQPPAVTSPSASRSGLRGSTQMLPNNNFRTWQHVREPLFGKNLSIVVIEEKKYLIGVQVAKLLKRETFNLYRSMKVKGIEIVRAVSEQVEFLMRVNAVKRGTRSVTLIAYEPTVDFVENEFQRIQKGDVRRDRYDAPNDSDSDSFSGSTSPSTAASKKRASAADSRGELKRSRSSSEEDPEEYSGELPEPWEILLSLAHGRFAAAAAGSQ